MKRSTRQFFWALSLIPLALVCSAHRQAAPEQNESESTITQGSEGQPSELENTPADSPSEADSATLLAPIIAEADRLHPCRVELEHRFLGEDDETWETTRVVVTLLTRQWGDEMRGLGVDVSYQAPIPMTREQALALMPGATEQEAEGHRWVQAVYDEQSFAYRFDEQGRTVAVDWDPVADSSVYTFHYSYDCTPTPSEDDLPIWIDDLDPE